jgi:hypothetical protein
MAIAGSLDGDPVDLSAATGRCAAENLLLRWCGHLVHHGAPDGGR